MYKVKTQDLEKILKSLKLAEHSFKGVVISNSTRTAVVTSIKLIENEYLNIKPNYLQTDID